MVLKILSGVAALFAVLFVVIAVNTLRIGPPPPGDVPPPADIAFDGPAAAGRLAEALRFRTISHAPEAPVEADALVGLRAFLAEAFPKVHATLTREIVNGYSLLYTWTGSDPTLNPILLAAHMDVVPVEPGTEADWTHPPFAGAVADGFVWGRGAMDMKSSLMGILEAVEYLLDRGMAPKRTVYLAFGHDEEVGGTNGTAKIARLLAKRGVRLGFTLDEGLVIAEGIVPGVTKPAALVGLAEKGRVSLELVARGECGHSSMPPVSTAAGGIGRALHRLETNQMPAALKSPVSGMFDALAPEMPIFMRAVVANRWLLGPLLLSRLEEKRATNALIRTTTAATVIRGGVKSNMVPCTARAVVDFRILPGDSVAGVIAHMRATIDDPNIQFRRIGGEPSEPSPVSDIGSASFAVLHRTVRQVFPDAVVAPGLVIARTDSRHYATIADNSYRFLPLRLGPRDLKRIHGTDERVSVENYAEIVRFYVQVLRNFAMVLAGAR